MKGFVIVRVHNEDSKSLYSVAYNQDTGNLIAKHELQLQLMSDVYRAHPDVPEPLMLEYEAPNNKFEAPKNVYDWDDLDFDQDQEEEMEDVSHRGTGNQESKKSVESEDDAVKLAWIDCETTGTDPYLHDIIEIAFIIEIGLKEVDRKLFKMQPFSWENIEDKALEVNGYTREELAELPMPGDTYEEILEFLDKHIDKFDRSDKFHPAGQNVRFDIDFLEVFFKKNDNSYFGSYFFRHYLDTMAVAMVKKYRNPDWKIRNFSLKNIATALGLHIPENLHTAMADIDLTRSSFQAFFNQQ